jgi:hypothetical protein
MTSFRGKLFQKGNLAGSSSSISNPTRRASADLSIFPAPQAGSLLALPVNPTSRWGTLILVTLPVSFRKAMRCYSRYSPTDLRRLFSFLIYKMTLPL